MCHTVPDADADQAPADQSVVLWEQLFDLLIIAQNQQGILLRLTGCHVADEVIGVKKAVHPDDKAEEQQR